MQVEIKMRVFTIFFFEMNLRIFMNSKNGEWNKFYWAN